MGLFSFSKQLIALLLLLVSLAAHERDADLTVEIPMRDGTLLPTDIYLPRGGKDTYPIILVRTPSGKRNFYQSYIPFTELGYIVVIQDGRNFIDPEGKTFPWLSDGWGELQDGYDTIAYFKKSPYSNGSIGTLGFSAMGITQLLLSPTNPSGLKAQYIAFAASDIYGHAMYHGGKLRKNQVEGWLGFCAKDPLVLQSVLTQGPEGDLWKRLNCLKQVEKINVPAIHLGGWYDIFSQGTLDAFSAIQRFGGEGARGKQILVMGPWTHHYPRDFTLGDFQIPENGKMPPHDVTPKSWFDYHLKGIANDVPNLPKVIYYVLGPLDGSSTAGNRWKTAESWPLPAKPYRLYLSENQKLETSPGKAGLLTYSFDASDPVPTHGGRNLFLEAGPKDQREIEERNDVIVFTTAPLEKDLEVTGRVSARLFVSSTAPEIDIAIRLTDVYPDGKSVLIADGIQTVKAPGGEKPALLDVDLWSISQLFAKGHAIRISISSSNYPQFDTSMKEGRYKNRIYFGGETSSEITLPEIAAE